MAQNEDEMRELLLPTARHLWPEKFPVEQSALDAAWLEKLAADLPAHWSDAYRRDVKARLKRLAKKREGLRTLSPDAVRRWVEGWAKSERSYNNYLGVLRVANKSAKEQDLPGLRLPGLKKVAPREVEIFPAREMKILLEGSPARLLPAISLGGFAGLRSGEICRLGWEAFDWPGLLIHLRRSMTKTRQCRDVPITPALEAWLMPYQRSRGPVCLAADLAREKGHLAHALGLRWRRNGLRHSYGTYRLAEVKDLAQVALEMGNSPGVVQAFYRENVATAEVEAWWALRPEWLALDFVGKGAA